jgi:hypothetical protein
MNFKSKYLKYKSKYLQLKQLGGHNFNFEEFYTSYINSLNNRESLGNFVDYLHQVDLTSIHNIPIEHWTEQIIELSNLFYLDAVCYEITNEYNDNITDIDMFKLLCILLECKINPNLHQVQNETNCYLFTTFVQVINRIPNGNLIKVRLYQRLIYDGLDLNMYINNWISNSPFGFICKDLAIEIGFICELLDTNSIVLTQYDDYNSTYLHSLCARPDINIQTLKIYLDHLGNNDQLNHNNSSNITPFYNLCVNATNVRHKLEVLKFCFENGADRNLIDHLSPVFHLINRDHIDLLQYLKAHSIHIQCRVRDEDYDTKQLICLTFDDFELATILVRHDGAFILCLDEFIIRKLFDTYTEDQMSELVNYAYNTTPGIHDLLNSQLKPLIIRSSGLRTKVALRSDWSD